MALAVMFLLLPLVIYLVLVVAKPGVVWRAVVGCVALLLAYIWLGYLMAWQPLWTGDRRADAYTLAAANIYTIAGVVGVLTATFGRNLAAQFDFLTYPIVALAVLAIAMLPFVYLLGV